MPKIEVDISPLAYAKIIDWTSSNTEREVGGYLIGKIKDNSVQIIDSTFSVASSTPTHVAMDEMAQFRIIEEIEKRDGKETIVGFWHTHPGIGVFMSSTDIATQQIYQALLPEAIAMVNDGNIYARTRNQNDFIAKFFRVNQQNKAFEVNFGVMTNPNMLVDILTNYVQDEESVERIAERTAQKMSVAVRDSLGYLTENIITKMEFEKADTSWKKGLASTRKDIDEIKEIFATKEDLNRYRARHIEEARLQRILSFITIGLSVVIIIIITIILAKSFVG
ncbi:MAG: hypothetical protein EAX90_04345 [Candidatus Heimdallarchaeota archaeon]|nr:hypothetical protein [Candidatus Heimdallarchaeota archaeon]